MTYTAQAVIRDYAPGGDTATVELRGIGVIDTWIDGIALDVSINRANVTAGMPCIVSMVDAHRICEATITAVFGVYGAPASQQVTTRGRSGTVLSGAGGGALTITYGHTYTSAPTISAQADTGAVAISGITTTGFTATISGGVANSTDGVSWVASGV